MSTPALSVIYDPAPWSFGEDLSWSFAPFGEGRMGKVNPFYFYQLGDRIGNFRCVFTPGSTWGEVQKVADALLGAIHKITEDPWVPEGLEETQKAAGTVLALLEGVFEKYKTQPLVMIAADDFVPLNLQSDRLGNLLHSDLERLMVWHAPDPFCYGVGSLTTKPWLLFGDMAEDVRQLAERDLLEFGRAFAFESGTAAGFHMLRACELVLIEYCRVCDAVPDTPAWGNYIGALKRQRDLPAKMGQRLDAICKYDRNEIMHPVGRFLTMDDVSDLLDTLKVTIKDMIRDIRRRKAARGE